MEYHNMRRGCDSTANLAAPPRSTDLGCGCWGCLVGRPCPVTGRLGLAAGPALSGHTRPDFVLRKKRKRKPSKRRCIVMYRLIFMPKAPVLRLLALSPHTVLSYVLSETVTNGRSDHCSVKINGEPSPVQDQAFMRKLLLVN